MATVASDHGKSLVTKSMDAVKAHIRESGMRVGVRAMLALATDALAQ